MAKNKSKTEKNIAVWSMYSWIYSFMEVISIGIDSIIQL